MTDYERALITGQYLSFSNDNGIDPRLFKKGYTEEQLKIMRKAMGSQYVVGGSFKFSRDLKEIKHPNFNFLYSIYDAWQNHNTLPFKGCYTEQPNKVIEYFHIFDQLRHESEQKAHAKMERDHRAAVNKRK